MDAHQFLAEFGHIANAPGGVARLRELVLLLAVQGRLVKSHQAWTSTTLGKLGKWGSGGTPAKTHSDYYGGDIPWLVIGDLNDGDIVSASGSITTKGLENSSAKLIPTGSLLVGMYGSIGKLGINTFQCATNQAIAHCVVDAQVALTRYLFTFIRAMRGHFFSLGKGLAQQNISQAILKAQEIQLPPLEEQCRIVARVDELMALCDQLEAQQQDRRKLQNALRQSTLQALARAQSPHELQDSWQRLQANFGRLFSELEDVRDFRGLILDLAVSGLLLPTTNTTSRATDLIEQIANARTEWAKTAEEQEKKEAVAMLKKLRTQQVAVPSSSLPEHWCWASLLQVAQAVVDCHNKTAPYVAEGIHLVRTTDIRDGRMDLSKTKKISEETYDYWARRMPPKSGDIFFTREAPMGEAAIVPDGERVCLGQRTMLVRLFPALFSNRYLLYVIQSPSFQSRMTEAAIGMTVKHLRVGGVEDLVVPVPPRAEQDQIVGIVDSLFELCDRHAEFLGKSRRIATNLSSAAVAALTGITIEQEEEAPVKAPQTELIAPLRLGTPPDVKAQAPLATLLVRHNGEMSARDLWQRFGGEIDAFYAQLKTEVAHGWIAEPAVAEVREKSSAAAGA